MFYSTEIKCIGVAEKLCWTDTIKVCAKQLRDECYKSEFHLEGIYSLAEDCNINYETYTASHPESWERFFNNLLTHKTKSVNIQRKCDMIFEIVHYFIHNRKKHNPFHVGLAEFFHDGSRANFAMEVLNKISSYITYDEFQRIDFGLIKQVIKASGYSFRCPSIRKHSFMKQ